LEPVVDELKEELKKLSASNQQLKDQLDEFNTSSKQGEKALNTKLIESIKTQDEKSNRQNELFLRLSQNFDRLKQ
jgi:hypothetical protein